MVPFEIAFSHLAPAAPASGSLALALSTSPSIVAMSLSLVAIAVALAAVYLSKSATLHATRAARWAVTAASTLPWSVAIKSFWLPRFV